MDSTIDIQWTFNCLIFINVFMKALRLAASGILITTEAATGSVLLKICS